MGKEAFECDFQFVYLVKEYSKTLDRSSAIERAIDDCIRQDVLKRFLENQFTHASPWPETVANMLLPVSMFRTEMVCPSKALF